MESRKKELLAILIQNNKIYSYEELCDILSISERLLRYSVDDVNLLLKEQGFKEVNKIRGKGIHLDITPQEKERIQNEILNEQNQDSYINKEEREIAILFSILNDQVVSFASDFQKIFAVSKSAIDSDMRLLRKECQSFLIDIVSNPKKGFSLQGDEWAIRLMINNMINTKFDLLKLMSADSSLYLSAKEKTILEYLQEGDVQKVFSMLKDCLQENVESGNELYCAQLAIYFVFWKKRYTFYHTLKNEDSFIRKYEKRHSQVIVDRFLQEFGLHDVEEAERNYLDFMVDSLNLQKKQPLSKDWVKCQLITIQFIESMSYIRGIPYANEEMLFENLFQHICALVKRLKEGIEIYNPLKALVEKEYQGVFNDVKQISLTLKDEFGGILSGEEIAYLSIHFSAAEEKIRDRMQSRYRVLVVCGHGVATGELLAERLKHQYQFDVIGVVSAYQANTISRLDVDFVLKTTDCEITYLPSLQINPMLAKEDYEKIQNFIKANEQFFKKQEIELCDFDLFSELVSLAKSSCEKLREEDFKQKLKQILKKHEIEVEEKGRQPMISEMLLDEYILLQESAESWQEAIHKVAQPLLKNKVIKETYIEAMINSVNEYGPYIVIGEGIALAHARPEEGVNELGISVMTLNPPVKFNHETNDPVSIVFCLAAVDNHAHLKMMSTIVKLINEEGKISQLAKMDSIDEFKKELFILE